MRTCQSWNVFVESNSLLEEDDACIKPKHISNIQAKNLHTKLITIRVYEVCKIFKKNKVSYEISHTKM